MRRFVALASTPSRGDVAPMGHQHQWDSAIFRKRVKIKFKHLRYRVEFDIAFVSN